MTQVEIFGIQFIKMVSFIFFVSIVLLFQVNTLEALNICFVIEKTGSVMGLAEYHSKDLCPTLRLSSQSIHSNRNLQESQSFMSNKPFMIAYVESHAVDISSFGVEFISPLPEYLLLLMKFNASHNDFIEIPKNFFEHMQNMIETDFSFNKIQKLSTDSFDGSYKLKNVNISHNQISSLNVDTFWDLTALQTLDLSYNLIEAIEEDLFFNNAQLMEVRLQHNKIKIFEFKINHDELCHLNIANNQLTRFDLIALSKKAKNLEYLNLNENRLKHLDEATPVYLPKLSKFGILRNYIPHEELEAFLKPWQYLDFIGNQWIQKIGDLTDKEEKNMKAMSTNTMMIVFLVVFSISLIVTVAVKFKIVAQVRKRLARKVKDAITLARYRSYISAELSDSIRSYYGQYRKVDY